MADEHTSYPSVDGEKRSCFLAVTTGCCVSNTDLRILESNVSERVSSDESRVGDVCDEWCVEKRLRVMSGVVNGGSRRSDSGDDGLFTCVMSGVTTRREVIVALTPDSRAAIEIDRHARSPRANHARVHSKGARGPLQSDIAQATALSFRFPFVDP
ncbi:MAG: hypothetical protein ACRD15_07790 [Vicinamibacterales bacterium]